MSVANEVSEGPRTGRISLNLGAGFEQNGFRLDVSCLANKAYRVELEQCPLTRQYQISLLEALGDAPGQAAAVLGQLFTYDINRSFEVVEHLMVIGDPRGFCDNLALAFGITEPGARIPLDSNPS